MLLKFNLFSRFGVVAAAGKQMRELYNWLEVDFHPLALCAKMDASLKELEAGEEAGALVQYAEPLRDMTLVRLLKQVAQVRQQDLSSIRLRLYHSDINSDSFLT